MKKKDLSFENAFIYDSDSVAYSERSNHPSSDIL